MAEISKQMITMYFYFPLTKSRSEVAIVQSTPNLKLLLTDLNTRPAPKFKKDPELFLFSVDSVLSQEEATFIMRPFSVLKDRGETAYSEPLVINGITWRLKVYPNGNGSVKGTYMSVFVEMVKGWGNEVGSYEYRVEMVNQRDPRKIITREFVSEFESSVSWGYNRFFK
jgi:tripartite motif-containing protein 37